MSRHRIPIAVKGLATLATLGTGAALVVSGCLGSPPAAAHSGPPAGVPTAVTAPPARVAGSLRSLHRPAAHGTRRAPVRAMKVEAPISVSIPRLGVSAAPVVERVTVMQSGPEEGLLSAPADYHDLGWYVHGDAGVTIVDGHVGFASGAGPLAYIGFLSKGDPIVVRFAGRTTTYHVTAVVALRKGQLPAAYFTSRYDGQLMLITCDYQSPLVGGHFLDNVYVVAAP